MPQTQIPCPQCGQPIPAEIRQVFDLYEDPAAKQTLLSGAFNLIQCPYCGYQGRAEAPLVYHDPEKELLLTYYPPQLGRSRDEQERTLGRLLNQIINRLPAEKRKAYLLQPETMLTFQTLIERILEADGITKEMLQAQEDRIRLIERLMTTDDEGRKTLLQQEGDLADETFFSLLTRLLEAAIMGGDQASAAALRQVYNAALEHTPLGQKIKQSEAALRFVDETIQNLGPRPSLAQVVDAFIEASEDDTRLQALTSALRPVLDYHFFQALSDRIENAPAEEKQRLQALRERLLQHMKEVDDVLEQELQARREIIEKVIAAENTEQALQEAAPYLDNVFLHLLEEALQQARQKGDLERGARISQVIETLEKMFAPPPELALLQSLLEAPDAEARQKLLEENRSLVNEGLVQQMAALAAQLQQQGADESTLRRAEEVYRQVLKFYMSHQVHL